MVPQIPYICKNGENGWVRKSPVLFFKCGRLGVKLLDVMNGRFWGIDDGDDTSFDENCLGITIRMHVGP